MAGRYQPVNTRDDDVDTRTSNEPQARTRAVPNSPPPSFHSRASSISSRRRQELVDSTLADAFDADGDDSEDEADDTQRLVRATPSVSSGGTRSNREGGNGSSDPSTPTQQETERLQAGSAPASRQIYGGGVQADGVFSNLSARPEGGETEKEEQPPSYEQAAADAAPPYWETTILAPGLGGPDEVYIDGMPVGSIFSFVWNGMISMSFQLVGFLLTYLLHSTHAAKNGSRAGLGITLIQYGFYMKSSNDASGAGGMGGHMGDGYAAPPDPNAHDFDPNTVGSDGSGGPEGGAGGGAGNGLVELMSSDWVAYVLMIVGWLILIRAVSDYLKARRHEQLVRQSPERGLPVPIIAEGEAAETVV